MKSAINQRFIEQLIIKAMPDIDDEALDMFTEDTYPVLYDRLMTNIATQLNDKQMGEFADLIEKGSDEKKLYDYLQKNIADYEKYIEGVYDAFEKKYLEEFQNFKKEFKEKSE